MKQRHLTRRIAAAAVAGATVAVVAGAAPVGAGTATGPNTPTAPYVLPVAPGAHTTSLLTVADAGAADNGYEMVGIPDGLGARRVGNKVELFMNQELRNTVGVTRAHGQAGAFVSKYTLDPGTDGATAGSDLITGVSYYDYLTDTWGAAPNAAGTNLVTGEAFPAYTAAFSRFCSSSLTAPLQLLNPRTGRGYSGQVYFANEENGDEARVFGVTTDGTARQLPRLGLFSWENTIALRNASDRTVVMGNEDGGAGQVWVYAGAKQRTGDAFDKAGLTNGATHVVSVPGAANDAAVRAQIASAADGKVRFGLSDVGWQQSGAEQNAEALAEGVAFNRVEDGTADPTNRNVYYFLTTEGGVGTVPGVRDGGGLWKMTFDDVETPELGGTLELLLDGSEGIGLNKPDNLTIDDQGGHLLIQEDPGNNDHVARIVAYRLADGATAEVARFDDALFNPAVAGAGVVTRDEESSGIIDVSTIYWGPPKSFRDILRTIKGALEGGTFLFDAQVHTATGLDNPAAQVERGQLLKLRIDDWDDIYGG